MPLLHFARRGPASGQPLRDILLDVRGSFPNAPKLKVKTMLTSIMEYYKKIFIIALMVVFYSSCNSRIGLGISGNKGDLLLSSEDVEEKQGIGFFAEYKWQQMINRNGIGVDYTFNYRGYVSGYKEGGDAFIQSLQFKYYYTLLRPGYNPVRLDFSAGLGLGHFIFLSNTKATPFIANVGVDIYFLKSQFIFITPKFGYIKNLQDPTLNLSLELSAGVYFGGNIARSPQHRIH